MALPYKTLRKKTLNIIVHHFGADDYYHNIDWQEMAVENHFKRYPEYHYHYVILTNGRIMKGNPDDVVVWHANNNKVNDTSVAVCLWGNLSKREPTKAQIKSLVALLKKLVMKYKISPENILGHRDVGDNWTECPGHYLYRLLPKIRTEVKETMGKPAWKQKAVNIAKKFGWLKAEHSPDEQADLGTVLAIEINKEIERLEYERSLIETVLQILTSDIDKRIKELKNE